MEHISSQKVHLSNTRVIKLGANKAGRKGRWADKAGRLTRQAG